MTRAEQNKEIRRIVLNCANGINRWKENGQALKNRLLKVIEMELSFKKFENDTAYSMYQTVILLTLAKNHPYHYKLVYPV